MVTKSSGSLPSTDHTDLRIPCPRTTQASKRQIKSTYLFGSAVLNSVSAHSAALDLDGRIIAVNDAGKKFALQNKGAICANSTGANYFYVCHRAARRDLYRIQRFL